ncbi:SH3 domain-containing protein [Methyloligella sp. 2.7D]|uniref:SH3 domain-containing protein n=1 Tax=unclassified Methyloligella TaxID=2625955 RepID=UPI00157D513E|nr:SH3 domain-containing protein [Methyloligella sp. GL2]QKP77025.1 SH3 domain-containing protein [Methyloligella sp. GL2]
MSNPQHDRFRPPPAPGMPGRPRPQMQTGAPQPTREELSHDALARHIAAEQPQVPPQRVAPASPSPRAPRVKPKKPFFSLNSWSRNQLILAGSGAALAVCLLIVGVVLLARSGGSGPEEVAQDAEEAVQSVSVSPADAATPPMKEEPAVTPVLSSVATLDAQPAMPAAFPIAIDGTDGLPDGSYVGIAGLPNDADLSPGRRLGEGKWGLRTDEIGAVTLTVPQDATGGAHDVTVALITAQGEVLDRSQTQLVIHGAKGGAKGGGMGDAVDGAVADAGAMASEPAEAEQGSAPDAQQATASAPAESETAAASADLQPSATVGSAADVPAVQGGKTMVVSTAVNLRKEPSNDGATIAVVQGGKKVQVGEEKLGWLHVTDAEKGQSGWIYKNFLKEVE